MLEDSDLSKEELRELARLNDVYASTGDGVHQLKERLVESIVGSRLNSRAIRGY